MIISSCRSVCVQRTMIISSCRSVCVQRTMIISSCRSLCVQRTMIISSGRSVSAQNYVLCRRPAVPYFLLTQHLVEIMFGCGDMSVVSQQPTDDVYN